MIIIFLMNFRFILFVIAVNMNVLPFCWWAHGRQEKEREMKVQCFLKIMTVDDRQLLEIWLMK